MTLEGLPHWRDYHIIGAATSQRGCYIADGVLHPCSIKTPGAYWARSSLVYDYSAYLGKSNGHIL